MFTREWTPYKILFFLLLINLSACTFQMQVLTPEPATDTGPTVAEIVNATLTAIAQENPQGIAPQATNFPGRVEAQPTTLQAQLLPSGSLTPPPPEPDLAPTLSTQPQLLADILNWTMQDENGCKSMTISVYHEMFLNDCHGSIIAPQPEPWLFEEMVDRFAPFFYHSGKAEIIFQGKGDISGEVWQRAIDRWAQTVYTEGTTGHVCASCQTILAWNLDSTPNVLADCRRLVVLNFGYAYADRVPCVAGGQVIEHAAAWLTTEEWGTFDTWLTNHLFTTQPEGYFGSDGQVMSQDEIAQLKELANSIYSRIAQN